MLRFWHFDLEALTAEQMAAEVYELSRWLHHRVFYRIRSRLIWDNVGHMSGDNRTDNTPLFRGGVRPSPASCCPVSRQESQPGASRVGRA